MSGEEDDGGDTLVIEPPSLRRDPAERAEETVTFGDTYATVKGPRIAFAVEFIWRDGRSFAMPYQLLPIPWWHPPSDLLIEYPGFFTVALAADGCLLDLHRRFRDRKVLWIRECGKQSAAPLAITSIAILQTFPSRNAVGNGFAAG